ncbi:LysM peptidoglycan-binding domain-containing protein [Rhodoflexus sp.]
MDTLQLVAQELTVPSQMRFADMELLIEPSTRNRIQNRANQLIGNWSSYRELSERNQLFGPLISQVLREEGCHDDMIYLAMQLSGLSADATSPRMPGAVGFWLITPELAQSASLTRKLQINNTIDERKNLLLATRAFAEAIKQQNYALRNWLFSALAYQVGSDNVFARIDRSKIGVSQMDIDAKTDDLIIDLLAYTFVFRNQQDKPTPSIQLLVYRETQGKTLESIARATSLPVEQVRYYNSWLLGRAIPSGQNLPVYLPVPLERVSTVSAILKIEDAGQGLMATAGKIATNENPFPVITNRIDRRIGSKDFTFATINGISGMVAADAQSMDDLAAASKVSKNRLIRWNDFDSPDARLEAGQVIYLKAKNSKGPVKEHLAMPGESLWSVSQMYGIRMSSLMQLNRISKNETLQPGRVLLLQTRLAKNAQPEIRPLPAVNPTVVQNDPAFRSDNTMDPNANALSSGIHIVQPGESIYDIAVKYNVGITDLRRWNGITGFSIASGMELKIRGEGSSTTPVETTIASTTTDSAMINLPTSDIDVMSDTQNQPTHIVKPGDNIYSIAMRYGIKLDDIRRWNDLQLTSTIKPGDVLKLYDPSEAPIIAGGAQQLNVVSSNTSGTTTNVQRHIVQRGENLTRIAARYGVSVANIRAWNNLQTDALAINQELIVSNPEGTTSAAPNTAATTSTPINIMPQGSTAPANNTGKHLVIFGESVEDITRKYGISTDDFYRWNANIPVGRTALDPGSTVFVADPAMVSGGGVNVTPQPLTPPVANTATSQPTAATGIIPISNAPATAAVQPTSAYIVQPGETLFSISRKFNIPVTDLMRWNGMDMNTRLQIGQAISLQAPGSIAAINVSNNATMLSNVSEPVAGNTRGAAIVSASANPATNTEEARIYTTVPGDNIYDLANRFGVRLNDFRRWNNIPPGVFSLPAGTPVAINESAAAQVEAMKAQAAQQSSAIIISQATRGSATATRPAPSQHIATATTTGKGSIIYHVVNKGETLFSIARKYNVKVSQIRSWNNMKNDQINVGSRIIVSR